MLVFAFGAAAALLLSAPALAGPPPLAPEPEQAVPPTAGIQHSPSIAVDPADPVRAVVAADDGMAPPFATTVTGTTPNWSISWSQGGALHYTGSASAGQPDVAWGVDDPSSQNVYLVETGSTTGDNLCSTAAGILFSTSSDGGVSYGPGTAIPVDTGSSTAPSTELVEPAIATAGDNIYIVYTKLTWNGASCGGTPTSSSIILISSNDGGDTWVDAAARLSPRDLRALPESLADAAPGRSRGRRVPQRRGGESADRDRDLLALRPAHGQLLRRRARPRRPEHRRRRRDGARRS